jgi:transmembrane sensor
MDYSKQDIDKFFEGKLSKKEANDFLNWLESPSGEKTYNAIIEDIWSNEIKNPKSPNEVEDPHLNVLSGAHDKENKAPISTQKPKNKKPKLIRLFVGMAASLIMVFSVSYIFYFNVPDQETLLPIASVETVSIERATPRGNKKIITLPDGSTVVLNADSKLTYNNDFAQNRTIHLEGEGFFEVVRDENHPFTVITDNIATTALGTSFNIKAYQGNPNIQITLATGKVRVENSLDKNQLEIHPGEAVNYSEVKNTLQKEKVDLAHVLSWKEGILHFEKTPFNLIVEDLERWYGVNIQVKGEDKIPEYKCSGTFKPHEYLSNVLKVLSYSVDFEYTIKGNDVILEFNQ